MSASTTNVIALPVTDSEPTVTNPVTDETKSEKRKVAIKSKPKANKANAKAAKKAKAKATPKAHKLDDGMKLVIGSVPATGALSPKRVAIVPKTGMLVATWRKKVIAAGLAPKADPECWALLGHLTRSGNLAVAETSK